MLNCYDEITGSYPFGSAGSFSHRKWLMRNFRHIHIIAIIFLLHIPPFKDKNIKKYESLKQCGRKTAEREDW
jgi:hypothetical protein